MDMVVGCSIEVGVSVGVSANAANNPFSWRGERNIFSNRNKDMYIMNGTWHGGQR
jgi:hypothetical protein